MVDSDEWWEPAAGRERRREAGTGLLHGIAVPIREKIAELLHIRRAVEVPANKNGSRFGTGGDLAESVLGLKQTVAPSVNGVCPVRDGGVNMNANDDWVFADPGNA